MQNLERQLHKETLHEKDSNSDLSVIRVQFDYFIHSKIFKLSKYNSDALEITQDFKAYTNIEAQTFKETIIQNMLKRLNESELQTQECIVTEITASIASSGDAHSSGIVSDEGNDQSSENQSNTSGDESNSNTCVVETVNSNVIPDSSDMYDNDDQSDQNVVEYDDERVALANLIVNLKLDIDENKKVQKQLKKANASLTHELEKCKSNLEETNRTLRESNSSRDSCLIALQNKEIELEKYKTYLNRTT
ncbi:hypothetical protein Tco_1030994 [Tanacetum coccineum]|uniref:Uncharacterized protein n=1 Tax=Tanacetum coccineum TaxID=301880 RepID=A0ABQ5G9E9_9ASTR